jgi:hypothetical protein
MDANHLTVLHNMFQCGPALSFGKVKTERLDFGDMLVVVMVDRHRMKPCTRHSCGQNAAPRTKLYK